LHRIKKPRTYIRVYGYIDPTGLYVEELAAFPNGYVSAERASIKRKSVKKAANPPEGYLR